MVQPDWCQSLPARGQWRTWLASPGAVDAAGHDGLDQRSKVLVINCSLDLNKSASVTAKHHGLTAQTVTAAAAAAAAGHRHHQLIVTCRRSRRHSANVQLTLERLTFSHHQHVPWLLRQRCRGT
jgi:hypothetical protein